MHSESALHSIAHTSSALTLEFFASGAGWQGGGDESWAIDNLKISINARAGTVVPEPASLALFVPGLAVLALLWRRKREPAEAAA